MKIRLIGIKVRHLGTTYTNSHFLAALLNMWFRFIHIIALHPNHATRVEIKLQRNRFTDIILLHFRRSLKYMLQLFSIHRVIAMGRPARQFDHARQIWNHYSLEINCLYHLYASCKAWPNCRAGVALDRWFYSDANTHRAVVSLFYASRRVYLKAAHLRIPASPEYKLHKNTNI